jgi:hypothetical protein
MGKSALILSMSIGHENQDERISILLADRFRYVRWKLYPGMHFQSMPVRDLWAGRGHINEEWKRVGKGNGQAVRAAAGIA